ncbi:M48 family metallopeptidase [Endozoicomonas numazuensis]|uniref:Metal-dependent hydrolase n=1 Tax=Endozoicomonas numazuensis TaxID=1137799 RepID=A0A081NJ44_9GAMM|nr:SprT family zinc-dependent metalloprotease [Endozoicomonas numazuensis]KEQ18467.1 metal-dependent hydrolase [Endozoicomonas numazuensis]
MMVRDIPVEVVRKTIKNLHLAVYPPDGRVRIAVPEHVSDESVRLAVISRLAWIRKQQAAFDAQPRQSPREMVAGESHYFLGRRYRLEIIEQYGQHSLILKNNHWMQLSVSPGTRQANREKVLTQWYREQLKQKIPPLLEKWQTVIGVEVAEWHVRKMKTRWGSCHASASRILINLELVKKPVECLEYILVHELVHLLERHHNDRFKAYMDRFLPQWRLSRDLLNGEPLGGAGWKY